MKREIHSDKPMVIRSPNFQKQHEKQFAKSMTFMVEQIAQRFENQVLGQLQAKTIDKFEDAQIGNFSTIFLTLVKRMERKIRKQFSDDRIDKFTNSTLDKANKANQRSFYSRIESQIGIDSNELIRTEGLTPNFNALALETAQWSKKLRDDALEEFTARTLRAMTQGESFESILKGFRESTKPAKDKAKFLARNQIANYNSISTKLRAQNLGITEAMWITARDERVRPCHEVRDKKQFKLDEGLFSSCDGKTLLPGTDFNCRCTYDLIIPAG